MHPCPRHQRTLAESVEVNGFGYWSGQDVSLRFSPAAADTGVVFVLAEPGMPEVRIPAVLSHRIPARRRTVLAACGRRVEMVEHVLAALAGLGVDNCEVYCSSPEMPGCDGSALAFTDALQEAGVVVQVARRRSLVLSQTVRVGDDSQWIEARPSLSGRYRVRYEVDYGCNAIGRQACEVEVDADAFLRELAPARTFVLQSEAEAMRQAGLGGRVTPQDLLIFDEQGPMGNRLRFPNECARHKALDVVGDLSLLGCDLVADVRAYRSGHEMNAELVAALVAASEASQPEHRQRCA